MKSRRIVLATFGSLGDLHPCLAIARELARRGHRPIVATFDVYADAVGRAGVRFAPMRPSIRAFGDVTQAMHRLLDPRRGPEFLVRELFMPHLRESYEDLDRIAAEADLLVSHPIAFAAPLVAEKRGLPWASTVLAPMSLMSAVDPPLFPNAGWLAAVRRLGVAPYRLTFALVKRIVGKWEAPLHALRRELGIPSRRLAQFEGQYSPHLNLALLSPLLAAPQPDWPRHTVVCGFARYDGTVPNDVDRVRLVDFLAGGEQPVVVGLGSSAVTVAAPFWPRIVQALEATGRRGILLTGPDSPVPTGLPPSIAAFPYLPYSLVFPAASAVVHTCGIGTLAQALAAGRPQLILPVAFDQPDNARRAARLGVGTVLPFAQSTADRLASRLQNVLTAPSHAHAAQRIAPEVQGENGATAACDALERLLA